MMESWIFHCCVWWEYQIDTLTVTTECFYPVIENCIALEHIHVCINFEHNRIIFDSSMAHKLVGRLDLGLITVFDIQTTHALTTIH